MPQHTGQATPATQDQQLDLFAIALTILLCAIWGGAFVAIKVGTLDMPPLGACALRFCLTSVVLTAWAYYKQVPMRYEGPEVKLLLILGVLFLYTNVAAYVGTAQTTSGRAIAALLYLGLISAAFGFVAYAWLIQRNSATRVAALTFLSPVFAVAYGWLLLGEQMGTIQLLGVAGVCLGVYIVNSHGLPRLPTSTGARKQALPTASEKMRVSGAS